MGHASSKQIYRPLNKDRKEIRLLHVYGPKNEGLLRAELKYVFLDVESERSIGEAFEEWWDGLSDQVRAESQQTLPELEIETPMYEAVLDWCKTFQLNFEPNWNTYSLTPGVRSHGMKPSRTVGKKSQVKII